MLCRGVRFGVLLLIPALIVCCSAWLSAQAAPRQLFYVCTAQAPPSNPGAPISFYVSGVLQGSPTAAQTFRTDFAQFLMQRYNFKGAATCVPANTEVNAQNVITQRTAALRNNARWSVVETGWTENAEAAAPAPTAAALSSAAGRAASVPTTGRANAANAASPGNSSSNAGGGTPNQSRANGGGANADNTAVEVASVIGAIFGTNNGGRSGSGAANNAGASGTAGRQNQTAGGRTSNATENAAKSGGNQSTASQVSNTLKSAFNSSSTDAARGNQPAAGRNAPSGLPNGALGAAEFGSTKLVVYGCGRQQEQIACVTDVTNENAKDSLVQSAEIWKDAFLVDDRGDRHQRTNGFFLNIDGEQRQQLDISYGKTAKFILMFDNVQARVQKVALRSPSGGLDVEEIGVISPDASQPAPAAK